MDENNAGPTTSTLLVWLDASIDEDKNKESAIFIAKIREVIDTVYTFTNVDECLDFVTDINGEKTFMITSGAFGKTAVPFIEDITQVVAIYVFCGNKSYHEQWAKNWPKVKGVFTEIKAICEALQTAVQESEQSTIPISIVTTEDNTTNKNLDQLDPSFMYSQILKEILLTINFEQEHIQEFVIYCRQQFVDNPEELKSVDNFEQEYRNHTPIWWYTANCFIYSMLNRVLRTLDVDIIIKMGFFIADLHKQIVKLHAEQFGEQHHTKPLVVYRGQGLSKTDFDQLTKTEGGLMSFNNFLSTNLDRTISIMFAETAANNPELVGIVFAMKIDLSKSSTPFANVSSLSCFQAEEEITFSMHSVFRIEQITSMDDDNRIYLVNLSLTDDHDPDLNTLTKCIREETYPEIPGWYRLGELLIKMGQFDRAQNVYEMLLNHVTDDGEKAYIYHQLGMIKTNNEEYTEAITFYEKANEIIQTLLPPDHSELSHSYNNIGVVYDKMKEYPKALLNHEKACEIRQKTLSSNHPDLATSYNNIAIVYSNMSEHSKALSSHEKAIAIRQQILPPNHPDLATSYNNIATVYYHLNEYSKALSFYERALEIAQHSLPVNHPHRQLYQMNIELCKKKL